MSHVRTSEYSASRSVLLVAGIVVVLLFAKVLLIPLAFALALCFLLLPAVVMLEKRGVRQNLAIALVSVLTCICLAAAVYLLSRQVLHVAQTLPSYSEHIQAELQSVHSPAIETIKSAVQVIENYAGNLTAGVGQAGGKRDAGSHC